MALPVGQSLHLPRRGDGSIWTPDRAVLAGTNQARITSILSGRLPHFSFAYPDDPVTTRESTVFSAAEFNTQAAIPGTRITIGSSFSGTARISANDIDVVMSNLLTISGRLEIQLGGGSTPYIYRVRWTGGNIGNIAHARAHDVLLDDVYATAVDAYMVESQPEHIFGYSNPANRIAIINSTLELAGDPTRPSSQRAWALHTWMGDVGQAHGTGFFVGNVLCLSNHQTARFISGDNLMVIDSVFNPDGAASPSPSEDPGGVLGNGFRIHGESTNVWIKDSWGQGFMQLNRVNTETTPQVLNALFDNFDRYSEHYAIYANANTGTIQNSSVYGGSMVYGTLSDGGGNTAEPWDGVTVPGYSTVGAIR